MAIGSAEGTDCYKGSTVICGVIISGSRCIFFFQATT